MYQINPGKKPLPRWNRPNTIPGAEVLEYEDRSLRNCEAPMIQCFYLTLLELSVSAWAAH